MIHLNNVLTLLLIFLLPLAAKAQNVSSMNLSSLMPATELNSEYSNRVAVSKDPNSYRIWVNAGLGVGTDDISGFVIASYQKGNNLLSIRGALSGDMISGDEFWDIGVLYGRATSQQRYHASISAGLAIVGGKRDYGWSSSGNDVPLTVGLPLKAQLNWLPTSVLGIGLQGFANINPEQSFAGLALSLQLGKLR